jgi:peptidoglycan hydrolase-like protein with peptidoglycan-binding domain
MIRKAFVMIVALFLLLGLVDMSLAKLSRTHIMDVQRHLKALGYECPCAGDLDEATCEALKAFQRDQGLRVDGIPGPETSEALKRAWQGKTGSRRILNAQRDLTALGYDCPCTGELDEATMEAVKAFQRDQGLKVDGIPGPETSEALNTEWSIRVGKAR